MALKAKPKSLELDILSEAEIAMERTAEPRVETERGDYLSPMSKKMHAGVDIEALPAMNDEEAVLFDKLRQRGTYVIVKKRGAKYYFGLGRKPLDTKMVTGLIKKGWLAKSARGKGEAYFVTSHMVFGWRKRIGI